MKRMLRLFAPLLFCVMLFLAACGSSAPQGPAASSPAAGAAPTAPPAALPAAQQGATTTYPSQLVNIMAPAAPGGGWDQTARAMQTALGSTSGQQAQVYNVPGAGGTVGLAQFVNDHKGDPHQLMVMGLVMVGAMKTNNSPVTLDQITPIATLTTEWMAVVVPTNSKYQNLQQLITDFKADSKAISWGGGSAGGTDHILVGLMAKEAGVLPASINYIAHGGGGEVTAALLSGATTVGVSGLSEFRDQITAGTMRLLAVSSDERLPDVDAPTIKEAGLNVTLPNWRGVVAPPDISPEQRAAIIAAIEKMRQSQEWQQALEKNRWNDFYRSGDEFATFLSSESSRIEGVLRDIGLIS